MKKIHINYTYSFRCLDNTLDTDCIASKLFKGNTLILTIPKHKPNLNFTFNHPYKELIWAAKYYGVRDNKK